MLERRIPYIIVVFYLIYFLQSYYSIFALLSTLCILLAIGICGYYLLKSFLIKRRSPLILSVLILIVISYICSLLITDNVPLGLNMIKNLVLANFVIFPIYYLTRKGKINESFFKKVFILLFIYCVYDYFVSKEQLLLTHVTSDEVVNNIGYNFVCILPMLFFFKNKYLKYLFIGLITLFVLYSGKRGAVVTLMCCLLFCIRLLYKEIKRSKYSFFHIGVFLILLSLGFYILFKVTMQNDFLIERLYLLFSGYSSGRDYLFEKCWTSFWEEGSLMNYLFGYGLGATVKFSGNFAHNDWLELLVNNGIVGVILLFIFYSSSFFIVLKCKNIKYKNIVSITFVALFVRTLFSMSFAEPFSFPLIMVMAYVLAINSVSSKNKRLL